MKTEIEIEVGSFLVPDSVIIRDGFGVEGETVELKLLDALTLDRLCDEFRTEVFKKAEKVFPPMAACATCGKILA